LTPLALAINVCQVSIGIEAYFRKKPKINELTSTGVGWVINVSEILLVVPEDIAKELQPNLKGCRWRIDVDLEGERNQSALNQFETIVGDLISTHDALIYDPQTGQIFDKEGLQPIVSLPTVEEQNFSLQIYFENADKVDKLLMGKLLDVLAKELPEALPHRYGEFEPPQGRWDKGGREAFLESWSNDDPPFWIGKTPVGYVFSTFAFKLGYKTTNFRAGHFDFQFRSKLMADPKKVRAVMRVAEQFALLLDAFYAAFKEGIHDASPWWCGINPKSHFLIILGPPLLGQWDKFVDASVPLGMHHRSIGGSKTGLANFSPDEKFCYSLDAQGELYAPIFPFVKADPYSI
jgi:hypothetical protein